MKFYFKIIIKHLSNYCNYPIYYTRESLNIIKSTLISLLLEFPNFKLNKIIRKTNGVYYSFNFKFAPRFRRMYLGLNSNPVIHVMLRHIIKGSVFIDVGANVGYLSAIGAGCVGKEGQVHSFEPVPLYFEKLKEMTLLNKQYQIFINNFALGDENGTASIDINNEIIGANTMVSGLLKKESIKETLKIDVKRLDNYIIENNIQNISLIKIDVEGFEYFLLKGLTKFFEKNIESLPPIIMEITPFAYPLLGHKLEDIDNLLKKYNYVSFNSEGTSKLDLKTLNKLTNVLIKQNNT